MRRMLHDLLSRASVTDFDEPGPDDETLRLILAAAVRAPDHGKLRPWHFYIVRGEARSRLSELFAEALLRREPAAAEAQLSKERAKPLRSPLIVAVVARIVEGHKIPAVEQVVSAAAAAMNIMNAVHQLGFGAKWVTGPNCYDPWFLARFGLQPADRLLGFIHIGALKTVPVTVRPEPSDFSTEWLQTTPPDR
jgi:nitroreductase